MFVQGGKPQKLQKPKGKGIYYMLNYLHNHIMAMNQSKIFAGIMIVVLNIASKFMTFRMSKTMESYLRYSFSRDVLVFAITWMGTRDIYTALALTAIFVILVDFLFNEESALCVLPESFIDHHANLPGMPVSASDAMASNLLSPEEKVNLQQLLDKVNGMDKTASGGKSEAALGKSEAALGKSVTTVNQNVSPEAKPVDPNELANPDPTKFDPTKTNLFGYF